MMLGLPRASVDPVDEYFQDGQILSFGQHSLEVLFTPGHTPGSTCFRLASGERQMIFSGDTLFRRSVGRTDLPGGDFDELAKSIKTRLYTLDGDSEVIPGHGPATRIGDERRSNPYVKI
jgi:glyoxylase-like metal-dependent hydrolase (beta-lactamase superfamily II)